MAAGFPVCLRMLGSTVADAAESAGKEHCIMMFTESLRNNFEFRRLYYRGKSMQAGTVVVYLMKNRLGKNRLGLTVGGKLGGAVQRNLIRRRMKESYRLGESRLRRGYDIVIAARPLAVGAPYDRLDRDILFCLKKLGVVNETTNIDI